MLRMHPLTVAELGVSTLQDLEALSNLSGFPEPFFFRIRGGSKEMVPAIQDCVDSGRGNKFGENCRFRQTRVTNASLTGTSRIAFIPERIAGGFADQP